MHKPRPILLVEDNLNDAELTIEALASMRLSDEVTHVRDGVEAMDYLRYQGKFSERTTAQPSVVLLDVKMPRMDGIEVLQAIRSEPELKLLPVVMLSSSREDHDVVRSYEFGSNAYVVKPVKFADFTAAIKQLGGFWAMWNELPQRGDP